MDAPTVRDLLIFPEFQRWDTDPGLRRALNDLTRRLEIWTFEPGDFVRFPDETDGGPLWVVEGDLVVLEKNEPRLVGVRERVPEISAWVRGQSQGRYWRVPSSSWQDWLRRFPAARQTLGLPAPPELPRVISRRYARRVPGERVVAVGRLAPFAWLARTLVPFSFLLIFLAVGGLLWSFPLSVMGRWIVEIFPLFGAIASAVWLAIRAVECQLETVVLTDQALLIQSLDVGAQRYRREILAVDKIREAKLSRGGWLNRSLGLSVLTIEADSPQGVAQMAGLRNAREFLAAIQGIRRTPSAPSWEKSKIREVLARHSSGARAPRKLRSADGDSDAHDHRPGAEKKTFRRHPWHTLRRAWPSLVVTGLLGTAAFAAHGLWPSAGLRPLWMGAAAALIPVGRLLWIIRDTRNDVLELWKDRVAVIHRKPLWLGEVRQETLLSQIDQVGVRKPNFWALVFDFGDLVIRTGGAEPLLFEDVSHPDGVQAAIFQRRSENLQNDLEAEELRRLEQVSAVLDAWDEARRAGYFHGNEESHDSN